eukprot:TRINITY_DN8808_c0_g2_i1.p1 TRINITY_DN8808_c0_g2~~TRINITY_DN8808_c0_g2_i1.p1  ORF type:complete len:743 (-),score=80.44 TRINITY_DN8808_c0_g2_i1:351-2519(-)
MPGIQSGNQQGPQPAYRPCPAPAGGARFVGAQLQQFQQHPQMLPQLQTQLPPQPLQGMGVAPLSARQSAPPQQGGGSTAATPLQPKSSQASDPTIEGQDLDVSDADSDLKELFNRADSNRSGSISLLEFASAVQGDAGFAGLVMPGIDCSRAMNDPEMFDAVHDIFSTISLGKARIDFRHLKMHVRGEHAHMSNVAAESQTIFDMIDSDRNGLVAKIELLNAAKNNSQVLDFVLPGHNSALNDEDIYEAVDAVFDAIAHGKHRFEIGDFTRYFCALLPPLCSKVRRGQRILIIGPGFGSRLNPRQTAIVMEAGFQVHFVHDLPNPEVPNFPMMNHLPKLKDALDHFRPDLIVAASKGGAYLTALWATGFWRGASLLLNAHPSCIQLPKDMNVVIASGSNDEVYVGRSRGDLEKLSATGTVNRTFLYYSADSGMLPNGQKTRNGDQHNMMSLLEYNCLPRLIDAALDRNKCPEMSMIRSWRDVLAEKRNEAEQLLGLTPEKLRRYWRSNGQKGFDECKLFDVPRDSEEYQLVMTLFRTEPKEQAAYCGANYAGWQMRPIVRLQRVESGEQGSQCVPYFNSVKCSIVDQGLSFEPGAHTRWGFHGAASDAIDSIVHGTVTGFQPLAAGTKGASLWGSGTYFARDAKYVAEGGFAKPTKDGQYMMLVCLLATGIPCLGGPEQRGVLPFRSGNHRYHSTVDSLSSPEVFIVQQSAAAYPAYLVTFA